MAKPKIGDAYEGDVGYRHPWHYALDSDGHLNLELRLSTDGDGHYVVAGAEDLPHFERFHQRFADVPVPPL